MRALLKSPDKDPCLAASYRPICLLPLLGKAMERLIKKRLSPVLFDCHHASPWQFGFRRGKSAEDALRRIRHLVAETPDKYAVGILFDATAPFDHLW